MFSVHVHAIPPQSAWILPYDAPDSNSQPAPELTRPAVQSPPPSYRSAPPSNSDVASGSNPTERRQSNMDEHARMFGKLKVRALGGTKEDRQERAAKQRRQEADWQERKDEMMRERIAQMQQDPQYADRGEMGGGGIYAPPTGAYPVGQAGSLGIGMGGLGMGGVRGGMGGRLNSPRLTEHTDQFAILLRSVTRKFHWRREGWRRDRQW